MIKLFTLFLIVALSICSITPALGQQETKELQNVTLRMSWYPFTDYAPFLIAQDKGFYADEGLNVKLVPGKGSVVSSTAVAIGENDFGIVASNNILMGRIKGMSIQSIAALYQDSPVAVIYSKSKGIKSPKDLEGKTLAAELTSTKYQQFIAFCKKNGVDIEKIKIISISGEGHDIQMLFKGEVDLILQFNFRMDGILKNKGLSNDFEKMIFADYGIHIYNQCIAAHDDTLKNRPDMVKRFVRASLKGWLYAMSHPEEAIDSLIKHYPEMDGPIELDNLKGESFWMENEITKKYGFGYQTQERWESLQDLLYDLKIIDKKIDVTTAYTNKFIE